MTGLQAVLGTGSGDDEPHLPRSDNTFDGELDEEELPELGPDPETLAAQIPEVYHSTFESSSSGTRDLSSSCTGSEISESRPTSRRLANSNRPEPQDCSSQPLKHGLIARNQSPEATIMEDNDQFTQPSTQPFFDPRRIGRSVELGPDDGSDILITLHPTSVPAIEGTKAVARYTPQHILQNVGPSGTFEKHGDYDMDLEPLVQEQADGSDTQPTQLQSSSLDQSFDLALRFSSKVRDPSLGWVFGREKTKCDILLQDPDYAVRNRISGMHFRIYVTDQGIIMIEDMSTNGTYVDDILLHSKAKSRKRTLQHGSTVSVIVVTDKILKTITTANYIVRIPDRSSLVFGKYVEALGRYISSAQAQKGPGITTQKGIQKPQTQNFIGLGSTRFTHGMHWNGGEKYSVIEQIGKGAFATVYKLADKNAGSLYAAKEIDKHRFMKNGVVDSKFGNELLIIKKLNHPHIVKYCDYHDEPRSLYIIMEYVQFGDMAHYQGENGKLPEALGQSITRQLCQSLKYIHDEGVTHRDIKPENILVAKLDPMVVKLTDFGLSKLVEDPNDPMKTFCGTLLYCAPEIYPDYANLRRGDKVRLVHGSTRDENGAKTHKLPSTYSRKVDMWSLAAVMFHLLTNEAPYMGTSEGQGINMLRTILTRTLNTLPLERAGVGLDGRDFLASIMQVDPANRPTAAGTLLHPWIRDIPDVEEIPLSRTEREYAARSVDEAAVFEPEAYESDYEDSGFSNRVNVLSSQAPPNRPFDINQLDIIQEEGGHLGERNEATKTEALSDSPGEYHSQDLTPDDFVDGSNGPDNSFLHNTPLPNRPRLFGEVALDGALDSGIFPLPPGTKQPQGLGVADAGPVAQPSPQLGNGNLEESGIFPLGQNPLIHRITHERTHEEAEDCMDGLQNTVSQLNNLDIEITGASDAESPKSDILPSPSLAASGIKRARESAEEHDEVRASMTASKRHAATSVRYSPDLLPSSDRTAAPPLPSQTSTTNGHGGTYDPPIRRSPTNTQYGILTPSTSSIPASPICLMERVTCWGRAPRNTHVFHDNLDTRVPKLGMDIVFWAPGLKTHDETGDLHWSELDGLNALIMTRATNGIRVNGVRVKMAPSETFLCGKLRTGDVIEIFDDGDEHLRFECDFSVGESKERRGTEEFMVEENGELWEMSNSAR